ncbi:MAG: radical SAM family heme chaperone HemW [Gaiellales bacterium]
MDDPVHHLYVHLPFCGHRCGYCDFVTVAGDAIDHGTYVDALMSELELERFRLGAPLRSVFLGGGTPSLTRPVDLRRLLDALPSAAETTIEANPETVTETLAALLLEGGVTRVSLGVQSFEPELLRVLERRAGPAEAVRAVDILRRAGFANVSLDLIYGIPGQTPDTLRADLERALALDPEHLSCYELEAKPGTRFTRAYGSSLARQAEAMELYFEDVVTTLEGAGYRWYETSNFCRKHADGRDLRAQHNLSCWRGGDYVGVGIGAVSTRDRVRTRNTASVRRYVTALLTGEAPPRHVEVLSAGERCRERLMLALRLDEPFDPARVGPVIDPAALDRLIRLDLIEGSAPTLRLTRRGRFLANAVTVELTADEEAAALAATL